jgi:hypothetical protein
MPRAIGANSRLHMITESTYGTAPGGNWRRMPFRTLDLGEEQPLIADPIIGVGNNRDAAAPFQDSVTVQGNAVVPVDLINFGHWLRLLLGAPTTSGSSPNFVHTFGSGASSLPSAAMEVAYPDVPNFDACTGVRANSMELAFDPTGGAVATIGLMGQGNTPATSTVAGTPTSAAYTPFSKALGSISRNGSALAQITRATVNFSNGMEMVRTIRADRRVEGVDPGQASVSASITARFENTTMLAAARAGTSASFDLAFTINSNRSLTLTIHEGYSSLGKAPIQGPNGIEVTFNILGAFNAAATRMFTAVLRNDQAGTVYV